MSKKLYVVQVEKDHIASQNVDHAIHAIRKLELMNNNLCQKVMITIDGYNDISDELFAILEVRTWVQKLFNNMPELFYYINQEMEGHIFLLGCLSDELESLHVGELKPIKEYTDFDSIPRVNTLLTVNNEILNKIINGILKHGKKMKKNIQAQVVAYNIKQIFSK